VPLFDGRVLARCPGCELVYMARPPTGAELAELNARYWTDAQSHSFLAERVEQAQMLARVEYLERRLPSLRTARILDVGSGYGMLSRVLRRRAHDVAYHAIESDAQCDARLRSNGVKSISRRLEDCRESDFDLVVLSHVLEHVGAPRDFLAVVRGKLAPSGGLFVEVPNQDFRYKVSTGTHLLFFSPTSVGSLLERTGFAVAHLDTVGQPLSALERARVGRQTSGRLGRIGAEMADRVRLALASPASLRHRLQVDTYGGARRWIRCLARPDGS
jgi:SAM-dependent methyltransferase